jgi:hypothetical protein
VLGETVILMGDAFIAQAVRARPAGRIGDRFHRDRRAVVVLLPARRGHRWPGGRTAEDAAAIGLRGTWALPMVVIAVIAIAVGDELVIAHPGDDTTLGFSMLTFGGPALLGLLPARCARSRPLLAAAGAGGARAPRGRHCAPRANRRDRGLGRRSRRRRGRGHGCHDINARAGHLITETRQPGHALLLM